MNNQNMLKPAAIGGILLGVLSSLPVINCACCIWMIGGGLLAAYLYIKESAVIVTLGRGVLLGLFAGIIGTIVYALFQIPMLLMSPEGGMELVERLLGQMDRWPGFTPENRKEFTELASRDGFIAILYTASLIGQLVVNCVLAPLGGALGVALFEKRKAGEQARDPQDTLPPMPPST